MVPLSKSGFRCKPERGFESHPLRFFWVTLKGKEKAMVKINLADLNSTDPKVKYACTRNLLAAASDSPEEIYGDLDTFLELLDSENNVLKWTGISIIGSLARVDKAGKIDAQIDKLVGLLNTGSMITANNAIIALANIAVAKPEHRDRITEELLKVESYKYATEECSRIAAGKVIEGISLYLHDIHDISDKDRVIAFAKRQAGSSRNATRKKAEQLLKKYQNE